MTDTPEGLTQDQEMFAAPSEKLEQYVSSEDFVNDFKNAASDERFKQRDAITKFIAMHSWALTDRTRLGTNNEDSVRDFFKVYDNFLTDTLDRFGIDADIEKAHSIDEKIDLLTEKATFNQRFSKALFKASFDPTDGAERRSVELLHSVLVAFHENGDRIGTEALAVLDGSRAQAGQMKALYDAGYGQQIFVPSSEDFEDVKRIDVMAGGDFGVVAKDGSTVVIVDSKGRYYEDGSSLKRGSVDAQIVEPNYRNTKYQKETEDFIRKKLNAVNGGLYVKADAKFIYAEIKSPTAKEYMTPVGELKSESDTRSVTMFFDQFGLK